MNVQFEYDGPQAPKNGQTLLQLLIIGLFCFFALRLWYLQIHKGDYYASKALDNRLRQETLYAPRGLLLDRAGQLVAINEPAYALGLIREDCPDVEASLAQVSVWTGVPLVQLQKTVQKARYRVKPFEPLIIVPALSFEQLSAIESNALRWPGLEIIVRPKRFYPQSELLAHILGYVAEASEQDLETDDTLAMGDTVGKGGIENVLEARLRGEKGLRQLEVDAAGRRFNSVVIKDSRAGEDLKLSIDLALEQKAHEAFQAENTTGAVVVLEPFTGQILAMVSEPSFDNNAFAAGLTPEQWQLLRDDPRHPLQNRVIQSVYPPGSVFKILVAGCGLSEGLIDPNKTVFCPGFTTLGTRTFRCWKKGGHGTINLENALIQSCDVYFYEMGKMLGVDRIERFAKACGFSKPTGIDLPHEKGGLIPSRDWKRKRFGEGWQGGENLNLAIGQGYTLVSPLQVARFIGALLNGGELLKPTLVASDLPTVQGRIPLNKSQIARLLDAMRETVESDRGTGKRLRMPGAVIGGKTGSAQVVKLNEEDRGKKTEDIPYRFRDHAWIASWGQKDGKSVVVVCMVEHGGHGGESAVPVAKALFDYMFAGEAGNPVADWPARATAVFEDGTQAADGSGRTPGEQAAESAADPDHG